MTYEEAMAAIEDLTYGTDPELVRTVRDHVRSLYDELNARRVAYGEAMDLVKELESRLRALT